RQRDRRPVFRQRAPRATRARRGAFRRGKESGAPVHRERGRRGGARGRHRVQRPPPRRGRGGARDRGQGRGGARGRRTEDGGQRTGDRTVLCPPSSVL